MTRWIHSKRIIARSGRSRIASKYRVNFNRPPCGVWGATVVPSVDSPAFVDQEVPEPLHPLEDNRHRGRDRGASCRILPSVEVPLKLPLEALMRAHVQDLDHVPFGVELVGEQLLLHADLELHHPDTFEGADLGLTAQRIKSDRFGIIYLTRYARAGSLRAWSLAALADGRRLVS